MILIVGVVFIVVMSSIDRVDAARPMPDRFDEASHLAYPSSMYEKARAAMETWMAMLPSGSSPKGPGH